MDSEAFRPAETVQSGNSSPEEQDHRPQFWSPVYHSEDHSTGAQLPHQFAVAGDNASIIQASEVRITTEQIPTVEIDALVIDTACHAFAEPDGYGTAEKILKFGGVVVIVGAPASGRRTAALRLLAAPTTGRSVTELLPDWKRASTRHFPRSPNSRFLLDLTYRDVGFPPSFARELQSYGNDLAAIDSQLAVIATSSEWAACEAEARIFTASLSTPPSHNVLKAHVNYLGGASASLVDEEPLKSQIAGLLTDRTAPHYAAELASLLSGPQRSYEDVKASLAEFGRWRTYINKQLGAAADGSAQIRALIIALAVLDGSTAEAILKAADMLLEAIGVSVSPVVALEGDSLRHRLDLVGAVRDGDRLSLSRATAGVQDAILDDVWIERPLLREPIVNWLSEIATKKLPGQADDSRIRDVLVRLISQHRADQLIDILFQWLGRNERKRQLAFSALDGLLVDPSIGSAVQKVLLQRARGNQPSWHLVALCGGSLAERAPAVALVRLRAIADRVTMTDKLATEFSSAISALLRSADRTRFVQVLTRLTSWMDEDGNGQGAFTCLLAVFDVERNYATVRTLVDHIREEPTLGLLVQRGWVALLRNPLSARLASDAIYAWGAHAASDTLDHQTVIALFSTIFEHSVMGSLAATLMDALHPGVKGGVLEQMLYYSSRERGDEGGPLHAAADNQASSDNVAQ
jgi:hypothetical protein